VNTFTAHAAQAISDIAAATGTDLALRAGQLEVDGHPVPLPSPNKGGQPSLKGSYGDLLGIKGLLPTVPQGDDRDRLLWRIVGEARTDYRQVEQSTLPLDVDLSRRLPATLPFPDSEAGLAVADAIRDRFFSAKQVKNLKPIHSSLPMNYAHGTSTNAPARWRMFSAEILVFLLYDETTGTADRHLIERLLEFTGTRDDLTSIDQLFLNVATEDLPYVSTSPDATALLDRYETKTRTDLATAGGAFCPASLALFRRDLETVLDTPLPKSDKVQWLTLLLSLHITTRMYRLAVVKGNELDHALARAAGTEPPAGSQTCPCPHGADTTANPESCLTACPLAGAIKFRTGTGKYRPISRRDPCRDSYVDLDQRRLLALPAVLVTINLALRAWTALGGPPHDSATADGLAQALHADQPLRDRHSAVCAALAVLVHTTGRPDAAPTHLAEAAGLTAGTATTPGLVALRDAVLRQRRTDLRHQSRDVVNQLMLDTNSAGGGSLVSRNGTHTFFEADERLLLMLVRLICPTPLPYDSFLAGLSCYGLAPQDANERTALADSLERLGLLVRYSDAGEASFVHYR
jgi:hypothetical protein